VWGLLLEAEWALLLGTRPNFPPLRLVTLTTGQQTMSSFSWSLKTSDELLLICGALHSPIENVVTGGIRPIWWSDETNASSLSAVTGSIYSHRYSQYSRLS
jgi:hypothetical protein